MLIKRNSCYRVAAAMVLGMLACHTNTRPPVPGWPEHFGFGKTATPRQIDSVNISIAPDGKGLPAGSGNAAAGKIVYLAKCAACHGETGAEPTPNRLVATLADTVRAKTIGNYWPYATTVFDYIRRAMPFNAPGSLTNEEVYSLTAFLLYRNAIISDTLQLNAVNLPLIEMPARKYYVNDDRHGGNEVK